MLTAMTIAKPNRRWVQYCLRALLLSLALVHSGLAADVSSEQAKAVADIKQFGGRIKVDEDSPDKPIIRVYLFKTDATDAALLHIGSLTKLQVLNLMDTHVTDAGLKNLEGLSQLRDLWLVGTSVTDAGLKHFKALRHLQRLSLADTKVTDAGMEHSQRVESVGNVGSHPHECYRCRAEKS